MLATKLGPATQLDLDMAARYKINKSQRLKLVQITGKANYEELESLFQEYVRDPEFEPDLRLLVDLRGMTDAIAGLLEIRRLKRLYQIAYQDAVDVVDVVIVAKSGIAYKAARAFALFMRDKRPLNIQITSDWADAHKKLGVNNEITDELVLAMEMDKIVSLQTTS